MAVFLKLRAQIQWIAESWMQSLWILANATFLEAGKWQNQLWMFKIGFKMVTRRIAKSSKMASQEQRVDVMMCFSDVNSMFTLISLFILI